MPDLPRRRPPGRPSWTQPIADRLTPTIKLIVIADALLFFFYLFVHEARPFMEDHLAIGSGLFRGELWQPLTSLFVHFDPLGFIFTMVGFWFVAASIESTQGTRRFLGLFLGAGVLANVAIALVLRVRPVGHPYEGASYALLALFVAFGRINGRQSVGLWPTSLMLQARLLSLILVGWAAVAALARGDWPSLAATGVAAAVGYFGAAGGGLREIYDLWRARRLRRRYRVLEGGAAARRPKKKYWN